MPSAGEAPGRVAILLSTYNGAGLLPEQLDSILGQTFQGWTLHWRDDGSTDDTRAVMGAFAGRVGQGKCLEHPEPSGNLGVLASYMALLRAVVPSLEPDERAAFADQDDVWLPEKLARGVAALAGRAGPALYCARYVAVDAALRRLGESARLTGPTDFPAGLTQNVATGCTILLNPSAGRVVAASAPPPGTLHDWWSYLVVTAAGGILLRDETPVLLYRQHAGNAVGIPATASARAGAAMLRGPGRFMALLRAHVSALLTRPAALDGQALDALLALDAALRSGRAARVRAMLLPSLRRQTWWETLAFRLWFLIG